MAFYKTMVKGNLGGVEEFSCSFSWGVFGLSPDVPDQAAVDGILLRLRNWTNTSNVPNNFRIMLGLTSAVDGWRVEKRAEDERILSVAEGALATNVAGLNPATKTPQDALVVSLRTNTPGPRGRGRAYWPALGATLSSGFQLTSPTPAAMVSDWKTFLSGVGNEINQYFIGIADARRVVLSVRSTTDHVCRDVVQLQVGSVLDTQRRRRDALPETYSSVTYP